MRVLGFAIESERKRMDLHGEASGELVFVATVRGRHNRWRVGGAPNEVCAVKESSREVEVAVAEEYIGDVSCEADGVLDVEVLSSTDNERMLWMSEWKRRTPSLVP